MIEERSRLSFEFLTTIFFYFRTTSTTGTLTHVSHYTLPLHTVNWTPQVWGFTWFWGSLGRRGHFSSKKFCCLKCFSTAFGPKVTDLPSIFGLTSISKSEAPKSTLFNKFCSKLKILGDLLGTETFTETGITNPQWIFLIWATLFRKLILEP